VGEGVETPEQSEQLSSQGCELQQGYLFSPALPAAEFERWVADYAEATRLAKAGGAAQLRVP
jgi:EAL domain-containing protein (putative c-di-GMP-specific phosphodiesterase class I)